MTATVSNLWEHGGVFPFGATGFVLGFQIGIFSFIGVELVGTAAAETQNPRKTLPKAINSIVVRILVFYVGALTVIMCVTPWTEIDPSQSPFVSTLGLAGFAAAAFAINLVVMTSAASSANSGVYSATRMVFALAKDGHAAEALGRSDRRQVPRNAVFFTCVFTFAAIPLLFAGDSIVKAFTYVSSICAANVLFTWGMIVVAHLMYQRKHPDKHANSAFKLPFANITPWLIFAFFAFIVFALFTGEDTRIALLGAPVWFGILAVLWQIRKRKLRSQGRPITSQVPQTPHPLDLDPQP